MRGEFDHGLKSASAGTKLIDNELVTTDRTWCLCDIIGVSTDGYKAALQDMWDQHTYQLVLWGDPVPYG